jgi:hypothetical protein
LEAVVNFISINRSKDKKLTRTTPGFRALGKNKVKQSRGLPSWVFLERAWPGGKMRQKPAKKRKKALTKQKPTSIIGSMWEEVVKGGIHVFGPT